MLAALALAVLLDVVSVPPGQLTAGDSVVVTKVDGGTITGTVVSTVADEIVLDSNGSPVEISRAAIAGVRLFRPSPQPPPAREPGPYDQAVSVDPLARVSFGEWVVDYQSVISNRAAMVVSFRPIAVYPNQDILLSGMGLLLQPRWYPGGHAPRGAWVGPYVFGNRWHEARTNAPDAHGTTLGAGVMGGYSWQIWRLDLSLGLAIGEYGLNASPGADTSPLIHSGVSGVLESGIGFLF